MTKAIRCNLSGCLAGMLLFGVTSAHAQMAAPEEGSWNIGARTGYSIGDRDLDSVPINFHIGYTLFKGKPWIFPEGALEIAVEPFLSPVTGHSNQEGRDASIEAGLMFSVLTWHFDLGHRLSPYIEGGLGILYHDFQGYELGGGLNFTEMLGVGLSYSLDDNLSLNVGYRYRHSSNAGLYDENDGLNTQSFLVGFSY